MFVRRCCPELSGRMVIGDVCRAREEMPTIKRVPRGEIALSGWVVENSGMHPLRCYDFLCLWPESSEQHLPMVVAGVLRLRAIKPSLDDRSAGRFAQDDGFVEGRST